jgi:hypothetical protein
LRIAGSRPSEAPGTAPDAERIVAAILAYLSTPTPWPTTNPANLRSRFGREAPALEAEIERLFMRFDVAARVAFCSGAALPDGARLFDAALRQRAPWLSAAARKAVVNLFSYGYK